MKIHIFCLGSTAAHLKQGTLLNTSYSPITRDFCTCLFCQGGEDIINVEIMAAQCKSLPCNIYHKVWLHHSSKSYYLHKILGFVLARHQGEWRRSA